MGPSEIIVQKRFFAMGIQADGARYIAPTIAFVEDDEQDVVPKEISRGLQFPSQSGQSMD